ncbi:type III-A CRISPR-associated RAMP protein Csm5 [Dysgonamonadaceae bacterium]|nr:type III-A CRISPR-associated RAMP protein Csm5 [Dysgonamonadaceae bacterium]
MHAIMTQQYQVKITTLTPVCIGDGQKLSPFSDYKLKGDKLIYLNQEVIKKAIEKQPNLIDDYVRGIISGMDNTGSKFDIESFLYNWAKLDLSSLTLKEIDSTAQAKGNKSLNTILKQAGKYPYIPGSSLKGAIKTALLYHWLTEGKNNWRKEYLDLFDENKKLTSEFKGKKKNLEDNFDNQLKKYEFSVIDSDIFPEESIKAIDTKRLHLKKGNLIIPQTWEAIKENHSTTILISSVKTDRGELLNWNQICKVINLYSQNSSDQEWEIFDHCCRKNEKLNDDLYDSLLAFYETMEEKINNADPTTCYLKLGSGKGYYFNSIGLALYDADKTDDKELFINFLRTNGFGKIFDKKNRQWKDFDLHANEFPLTRFIDLKTNEPLGWIRMELIKDKGI